MKFQTDRKKIAKSLAYASRIVNQKTAIPILNNVYIECIKDIINIASTNLEMGINMWIPSGSSEDGKVTVNAKFISDFVNANFSEKIIFENVENTLVVLTDNSKANFATMSADEYPIMPKIKNKLFTINSNELINSVNKVIFSVATDISKVQYTGVFIDFLEDKMLDFVTLDGIRLSRKRVLLDNSVEMEIENGLIIPAKPLSEFIKILTDNPDIRNVDAFITENKSQIIFVADNIEFSIRLIEGPYAEYKKIIPTDFSYSFRVNKTKLIESIKIAGAFINDQNKNKLMLDLDVENSDLQISTHANDIGDGEVNLEVMDVNCPNDLEVAFSFKFLSDILNKIEGDELVIQSKGGMSAHIFIDIFDNNFLHILMPSRR